MRNLKKILALVLALVMSFSLMATANAFTDDEKITDTYETAVTVLSGLKVFQGYDDGSFLPQGSITRAEVAAIIYRIVTGDVNDTQVGIYADYNKFDDVKSTSWYAGYVNFCANAEYIKGYDAKTFGPNDPVTGYQALAMILRALGYDKNGEFTGTSWQVQTAAVGENRGITKNISAGTLGTAATREVVAEILFRAILVNTVDYTPAFGYQVSDTSLGWETFELEEIEGVVVANEYADLYNDEALKAGKTELDVDGESYMLSYTTTLEDIGEARAAYVTEGKNVLYIADAGNTVFETGAASDIEAKKDFEKVTALERDEATEYFLNFDGGTEYEASDWRIEYVVDFSDSTWTDNDGAALEKANGGDYDAATDIYSKTIKAGGKLTATDLSLIKGIFTASDESGKDEYIGEVFVGTQSKNDISDEISYKQFVDKYIETSENAVKIDETDNGEWLKVIDNDGDGVADYVLLTEFAMSVIERISKDNEYTLADLEEKADAVTFDANTVEIDGDDIVTEDELAEDDVVIYTLIDGKYYMNIAEMVTETIDKKGINSKTETITCDGTDYVQSHIGYTDDTNYLWDVTDAHTEETYDLYLDHFGYVRLFIESEYNTYMLLTDGWYEDDNRTETFKAEYWNVEAAEKQDIDVVDNDYASEFIADYNWTGYWGDQETWGRLLGSEWTYSLNGDYATNIAGYSETEDGYALKTVGDSTSREKYMVQAFAPDKLKDRYLDADKGDDIQTTTNTQYYLVIRSTDNRTVSGWDVDDVITWTGYKNAPAEAKLVDGKSVGYAVTHESNAGSYNVADVVVFETLAYDDHNTYFVYARNNYNNNIEYVWGLGYNDEGAIKDQQLDVESTSLHPVTDMIEFYEIYDNETAVWIYEDYADSDIYAGIVDTGWDIEDVDYIQVNQTAAGKLYIENEENVNVYKLTWDKKNVYDVEIMDRDDVNPGDAMILFTDGKDNVEYAIWVGPAVMLHDITDCVATGEFTALNSLWGRIVADANYVAPPAKTEVELAVEAANAIKAVDDDNYAAAKAAMAELDRLLGLSTITVAEQEALTTAKTALDALIDAYEADQTTLGAAKTDALAELADCYDGINPANSQQEAALAAYNANVAKINAAASVEEVNAALAAAIIEMTAYDQGASDSTLAGNLIEAGYELDEVVSIMMENDKDLALSDVAAAIWASDNSIGDEQIVPAMLTAGVTPEEIFADYGKDAVDLAGYMKGTAELGEIVDGYVNYWLDNPKGLTDVTVAKEEDGTFTVAVGSSSAAVSDSDLVDVAKAAGVEAESITVSWTSSLSGKTTTGSVADFLGQWTAMIGNVDAGTHEYTVVISCGDISYTANLIKAEA